MSQTHAMDTYMVPAWGFSLQQKENVKMRVIQGTKGSHVVMNLVFIMQTQPMYLPLGPYVRVDDLLQRIG